MTQAVYVDATKSRIVPEGSPEAAFRIHVDKLHLLGISPEPEAKELPKPADKARRRPATK